MGITPVKKKQAPAVRTSETGYAIVFKIKKNPIPGSEKNLSVVEIDGGYKSVIPTDEFNNALGDGKLAIFIPAGNVVPDDDYFGWMGSGRKKIVRNRKIMGITSNGVIVPVCQFDRVTEHILTHGLIPGMNVASILGVYKAAPKPPEKRRRKASSPVKPVGSIEKDAENFVNHHEKHGKSFIATTGGDLLSQVPVPEKLRTAIYDLIVKRNESQCAAKLAKAKAENFASYPDVNRANVRVGDILEHMNAEFGQFKIEGINLGGVGELNYYAIEPLSGTSKKHNLRSVNGFCGPVRVVSRNLPVTSEAKPQPKVDAFEPGAPGVTEADVQSEVSKRFQSSFAKRRVSTEETDPIRQVAKAIHDSTSAIHEGGDPGTFVGTVYRPWDVIGETSQNARIRQARRLIEMGFGRFSGSGCRGGVEEYTSYNEHRQNTARLTHLAEWMKKKFPGLSVDLQSVVPLVMGTIDGLTATAVKVTADVIAKDRLLAKLGDTTKRYMATTMLADFMSGVKPEAFEKLERDLRCPEKFNNAQCVHMKGHNGPHKATIR